MLYVLIIYVGVLLSAGCIAATLATWILLPRWRTLQNYISAMQILMNALQVCLIPLVLYLSTQFYAEMLILGLFELGTCWSLCASILAYIKLVIVYSGNISRGKRYATMFCFGTVTLINVFLRITATRALDISLEHTFHIDALIVFYLLVLNLSIFIKIVIKVLCCGNREFFQNKVKRVVSIICVGLICDSAIFVYMFLLTLTSIELVAILFFGGRLLPQFVIVLYRKSTRDMWKEYLQKRRNRHLDARSMGNRINL